MRVPSNLQNHQVGFNMTPMIDVVFLLIIFFLVSSHLAKQESRLELPLPVAGSGQPPRESQAPQVTVNVLPDGGLLLAGSRVGPHKLQPRLQFERQHSGSNLQVRIRSDRGVPYRFIEPLLLACARAGIWNVSFAVIRPQDAR